MDLPTITRLYQYNSWANERALNAASRLAPADFTRDLKSSYRSIRDTLTHIVWAEWIWLQRWNGVSPTMVFSPDDFPSTAILRERFQAVAAERFALLERLTAEQLRQVVEYTNLKGEIWRYPLWEQLYHVVNHSTYHRGQIASMLRQVGAVAEAVDFLDYCDETASDA
jgi:uncharacterized damage-inducible protein DinB